MSASRAGRGIGPGIVATLAVACVAAPAAARRSDAVAYRLAPAFRDGALVGLEVRVRFAAAAGGATLFAWPRQWGGEQRPWRWARHLRVAGARQVRDEGEGRWRILSAPGAVLTVRYRIVSAYDADPTVETSEQARPVVRPGWFFAVGEALFGQPQDRDGAAATFEWRPRRSQIGFASDLEHLAGPHRAALRPGTLDDIAESVVIGGRDLRVAGSLADPARLRVASLGMAAPDARRLAETAMRVVAAERAFWGDTGEPFLIAASPVESRPGQVSLGGAGRGDAFALWLDPAAPVGIVRALLAHEYFHTWNPAALGGYAADESVDKWFDEGFTDYYARALLVRAGLIAPADFVRLWNEALLAYAGSPVRSQPGRVAAQSFWTGEDWQKLPYYRGALLAARWNARLRAASGGRSGLDDIVRGQRADAAGGGGAAKRFVAEAARFGLDVSGDVDRHIAAGDPILLAPDTFGPCVAVTTATRPVFERGFAIGTAAGEPVAIDVDPASAAYAAGIRDGMRIVRREAGEPGNAAVDYAVRVRDGAAERVIRFRPAGKRTITVQQLVAGADTGPRCAATLSGLAH